MTSLHIHIGSGGMGLSVLTEGIKVLVETAKDFWMARRLIFFLIAFHFLKVFTMCVFSLVFHEDIHPMVSSLFSIRCSLDYRGDMIHSRARVKRKP